MPLPYTTRKPLDVAPDLFNADGVLAIVLHGTRDDNDIWTFNLHPTGSPTGKPADALAIVYGSLSASIADTDDRQHDELRAGPEFRDLALESALFWVIGETRKRGWRLAHLDDQTKIIDRAQQPTLIIAHLVLVNETFEPLPGTVLLDEQITGLTPERNADRVVGD
ncbi:hypothetical protein [Amycolatopsis saalfeldensis]|uniref:Uncharacterized protein n=1 Tax=Amycolatopsis saalfeldensis TaxID=394193 RepID=A0A1H8YN59_9PSEU|nr:hypothetical protein [Amycolatopsis saalfeldensis]SEP53617.1 hypothetical protein SAMN04489732_12942 [Amycolatopsis saalfeldensis]